MMILKRTARLLIVELRSRSRSGPGQVRFVQERFVQETFVRENFVQEKFVQETFVQETFVYL